MILFRGAYDLAIKTLHDAVERLSGQFYLDEPVSCVKGALNGAVNLLETTLMTSKIGRGH